MKEDKSKVDFVVLWVDGSDEEWLTEKKEYKPDIDVSDSAIRFRDWENLKYWFRGVEKFAPWVNNIYFVTYGHLPKFLNINHPKLKIVKHKEFMDKEFLPTYNSNAIDLNLCKIDGLSEQFVYFNDDTFIINKMKKEDFFKNGLPCDDYAETPLLPYGTIFSYSMMNNTILINKHFNKKDVYKKNIHKYYNLKYGKNNIRTLFTRPYKQFVGFYNAHLPMAFLRSYCEKLWELEEDECINTSKNKFRTKEDITLYLVKQFQLLDGKFNPRRSNIGKNFVISNDNKEIIKSICKQKCKMICVNDQDESIDFEKCKKEINDAFEKILPEKSSFEI